MKTLISLIIIMLGFTAIWWIAPEPTVEPIIEEPTVEEEQLGGIQGESEEVRHR